MLEFDWGSWKDTNEAIGLREVAPKFRAAGDERVPLL
jgi:hypothetical protein